MRDYFLAIILCFCFSLSACGKADPITVPAIEDILSITVTIGEESRIYYDTDWITQVITDINNSKPTNKQSVQDVPQNENYIKLDIKLNEGTPTLFVYKDGDSYYIEQPYQGIYGVDSEFYDFILDQQIKN